MGDELGEDLVRGGRQVRRRRRRRCSSSSCCRSELFVVVARHPELEVFLAELRLEKLAETLPADCHITSHTTCVDTIRRRAKQGRLRHINDGANAP